MTLVKRVNRIGFLFSIDHNAAKRKVIAHNSPIGPRTYNSTNQYGTNAAAIVPTTALFVENRFVSHRKQNKRASKYVHAQLILNAVTNSKPKRWNNEAT